MKKVLYIILMLLVLTMVATSCNTQLESGDANEKGSVQKDSNEQSPVDDKEEENSQNEKDVIDNESPLQDDKDETSTDDGVASDLEDIKIEYTAEGIIRPDIAKQIISEDAKIVLNAIREKDSKTIAEFVHPVKGVRFTPYTYVSEENDIVFEKGDIQNFFTDQKEYVWGYYDGVGTEIVLTPSDYYNKFIYNAEFIEAEEIGYNEVLSFGNMLENQFDVYDDPIVVEYYFPGFEPDYQGMDWVSLRLVFERFEGRNVLVGIIHNQWTI